MWLPSYQLVIWYNCSKCFKAQVHYSLPWNSFKNDFGVEDGDDNDHLYLDVQGLSHLIFVTNLQSSCFYFVCFTAE